MRIDKSIGYLMVAVRNTCPDLPAGTKTSPSRSHYTGAKSTNSTKFTKLRNTKKS